MLRERLELIRSRLAMAKGDMDHGAYGAARALIMAAWDTLDDMLEEEEEP